MIVLIGCSQQKLDHAAPARELYTSLLFRRSVAWVERRGAFWAILSGKHGLVMPDDVLEPYDFALADLRIAERRHWGAEVARQVNARWQNEHVVILAGKAYVDELVHRVGFSCEAPLGNMRIGERLRWLDAPSETAVASGEYGQSSARNLASAAAANSGGVSPLSPTPSDKKLEAGRRSSAENSECGT